MSVFGKVVVSRTELIKITKQMLFCDGCAVLLKLKRFHRNTLS